MNTSIITQPVSKNQAPQSSPSSPLPLGGVGGGPKGGQGSGPKGARHTYEADRISIDLCFTCPLYECVGEKSPRCPINQARAQRAAHLHLEVAYVPG